MRIEFFLAPRILLIIFFCFISCDGIDNDRHYINEIKEEANTSPSLPPGAVIVDFQSSPKWKNQEVKFLNLFNEKDLKGLLDTIYKQGLNPIEVQKISLMLKRTSLEEVESLIIADLPFKIDARKYSKQNKNWTIDPTSILIIKFRDFGPKDNTNELRFLMGEDNGDLYISTLK